jgi:16S rRNA (uracil1498-N3)-methyltransferase
MLRDWPKDRTLYFCDERGGEAFAQALSKTAYEKAAILIGPEGGFTDNENVAIRSLPQASPVSLGPNILRADTAAVSAAAIWLALQNQT